MQTGNRAILLTLIKERLFLLKINGLGLVAEDKIGTMLPCNVIVQEISKGIVEVAAVNPMASIQAVENEDLAKIAEEIQSKLKSVIENL